MKKSPFIIIAILIGFFSRAQVKVGDVTLPTAVNFKGETLVLNGAGIREKFWFNLYVAGLYMHEKSGDAQAIIEADIPMAIKIHITLGLVTNEKMLDSIREGFEKSTDGNTEPIRDKIDRLIGFLREDVETGDVFDFVYIPSQGVFAFMNGELRGKIPGTDFKKALFGIWLSDDPVDDSLRDKLLGVD